MFLKNQLPELSVKVLHASGKGTILALKQHISIQTREPLEMIELLCKNIPLKDTRTLDHVYENCWYEPKDDGNDEFLERGKAIVITYRRR